MFDFDNFGETALSSTLSPPDKAAAVLLAMGRPVAGRLLKYFTQAELQATADDLFAVVQSGAVRIAINQRFALKDAAKAHEALASKQTTGATLLIP